MVEENKNLNLIIERCRKKDRKSQYELYHLYFKAMYNTACRIIGDVYTAEDITQEAFLSAFNKITTYSGEVAFGAWLKKIVVNRSIDFLRKQKLNLEFKDSLISLDAVEELPYDDYKPEELIKEVKKAVNQLSEGYKIIATLHILEGYDYNEISEILNIKSSTVRSQFARAKARLSEILIKKKQEND